MVRIENRTLLQFLIVDEDKTLALVFPNLVIQAFAPRWELEDEIYLYYGDTRYRLIFTPLDPYAGKENQ
jgi:hypothetical protein